MRSDVRTFVEEAVGMLGKKLGKKILEVGSMNVTGRPEDSIRDLFEGKDYLGVDMRPGNEVDLVMNAHDLKFDDGEFDAVICLEMLEHDNDPVQSAREMRRVLKKGGLFLVSTPGINFPVHEYPDDYWRLTPSAMKNIVFEGFVDVKILENNIGVFGAGVKGGL